MNRLRLIRLAVIGLNVVLALQSAPAWSQTWGESRVQFVAANPNGDWTFGFINEEGTFVPFNTTFKVGESVAGWCLDSCPGILGHVTVNFSPQAVEDFGVRWEPCQLCVSPWIQGKGVVIRWTSPSATSVRIEATASGRSVIGGKAALRVLRDKSQIFNNSIDGFAGRGQDHEGRRGQQPETSCAVETTVTKGSTVDFVVAKPEEECAVPIHLSVDLAIIATGSEKEASK